MSPLARLTHEDSVLLAGESPAAARLRDQIQRVARTPRTTVLLTGEPGLEPEQLARTIHALSAPLEGPAGPFQGVDCQRLAGEPGAGDIARLFAAADGGSLFLDQVAALDDDLQGRLLLLLEDRGHAEPGWRLIASSACDLEERVEQGRFREDLLYRLNVLSIRVPALRERRADLPELIAAVLGRVRTGIGAPAHLSPAAIDLLLSHSWPGNLLELEAVLGLAAVRAGGGAIGPDHLVLGPPDASHEKGLLAPLRPTTASDRSLRASEEAAIRRVLREEDGNRSRTARVLGINRTTLYNKLRLYGID